MAQARAFMTAVRPALAILCARGLMPMREPATVVAKPR